MIWPRKQKFVLKELSKHLSPSIDLSRMATVLKSVSCNMWNWRCTPTWTQWSCSTLIYLWEGAKNLLQTPRWQKKLQEKMGGYFPLTDWLGSSPKVTFFAFWFAYHPVDQNSAHLGQYLLTFKCDQIVQGQITLGFLNYEFSSIPFVLPGNLPWYPACSPWHAGSCISRWHSLSPRY